MPRRLPAKRSPLPSALTPDDARTRLLQAAGADDQEQARLLRLALTQVEGALSADSTITPGMPDWFARLQAAKFIRDLIGAAPSKTAASPSATQVVVNVDMPTWALPQAKVIDAQPS